MTREVALVRALPREVGHPEILGEGVTEGHGWIVSMEVRGQNLHEAWPALTSVEQVSAIRQLWARAQIVHDASPSLRTLVTSHGGFVPATIDAATAAASRADIELELSSDQLRELDIWLAHDGAEARVEDWRPSRLLADLLDVEGGYLAPLLR